MNEIWLLVSAGQGPAECQWVVARLIDEVCADASAQGIAARLLETTEGQQALPRSALLKLERIAFDVIHSFQISCSLIPLCKFGGDHGQVSSS